MNATVAQRLATEALGTLLPVATVVGSGIMAANLAGLFISAGYWFTASTSFANPAVAITRTLTDTFSGIRAIDMPACVGAELIGAALAVVVMGWLTSDAGQGDSA